MLSEVPEGWVLVRLDDVLRRDANSISTAALMEQETVAHYSLPAFDAGKQPVLEKGSNIKSNKTVLDGESLLFSKLNPRIPRVWKVTPKGKHISVCSTEFWALKPASQMLRLSFAQYLLNWNSFLSHPAIRPASSTNSHQRVDRKAFDAFQLPIPPLPEQKRIAEILSSVDESIQATQSVIDQAERVKRGLMEDLLTGGLGSEAIARGEIPEGWEQRCIDSLLLVMRNGISCKQERVSRSGFVPVSRIETISSGVIDDSKLGYVPYDAKLEKYKLYQGDILFSHINSLAHIGKIAYASEDQPFYHGMNLMLLRPDASSVEAMYLAEVLRWSVTREYFRLNSRKAVNQVSLNKTTIGAYEFPLPPLPEQKRIAAILSSVDEFIQSQKQIIDQHQVTKKGLMDDLLTGKVRTV